MGAAVNSSGGCSCRALRSGDAVDLPVAPPGYAREEGVNAVVPEAGSGIIAVPAQPEKRMHTSDTGQCLLTSLSRGLARRASAPARSHGAP